MTESHFWLGFGGLGLTMLIVLLGGFFGYGRLTQKVESGFQQTTQRLDKLNGNVAHQARELVGQGERIAHLEGQQER